MPGRRLFVEGLRDVSFIAELCSRHGSEINRNEIEHGGSLDEALARFGVAIKAGSYDAVGLIIDADSDARRAWAKAKGRLKDFRKLPNQPPGDGYCGEANGRRVGIWIMPDNAAAGNMERLAAYMVPQGDELMPVAQRVVAELPLPRRFKPADSPKAEIHTWLAWQREPGLTIGGAVRSRYLDANCPEAILFVRWIKSLYAI